MVTASPPAPARFRPARWMLWAAAALATGILVALLSQLVQGTGFSPVGLFSLLVGAVLGSALAGLARWIAVGHKPSLLGGALAVALIAAASQHLFAYLDYRASYLAELERKPAAALMGAEPLGLIAYLEHEMQPRWTVTRWIVDAVLIAVAAVGVVALALRGRAYCDQCRSWYAARRSGSLMDDTARRLATQAGIDLPQKAQGASFQLLGCHTGCGPAGLQLSWNTSAPRTTVTTIVWLDAEGRRQIEGLLDEARGTGEGKGHHGATEITEKN